MRRKPHQKSHAYFHRRTSSLLLATFLVFLLSPRPSTCFWTPSSPSSSANRHHESSNYTPNHVAFICDGNSRWAKARHLPTAAGHAAGAERLLDVLTDLTTTSRHSGVSHCTMYAFSAENWRRSQREVDVILSVMEATANRFNQHSLCGKIKVCVIGDLTDQRLPTSLVEALKKLQHESEKAARYADNPLTLSLAINYGGRQDIVAAAKQLAKMAVEGTIDPDTITEDMFGRLLSTSSIPDPDLIIRTSGECRLSNFMLWNAAYAELYFTPTCWPDFGSDELDKALEWFASRQRTYGARNLGESARNVSRK